MPHWEVGDWWTVGTTSGAITNFANEPQLTTKTLYVVVDIELIGGAECFVVERWSYPPGTTIDAALVRERRAGNLNAIYYFNTLDLGLTRQVIYYTVGGTRKAASRDFPRNAGDRPAAVTVTADGEFFPSFPVLEVSAAASTDGTQVLSRTLAVASTSRYYELVNRAAAQGLGLEPLAAPADSLYEVSVTGHGKQIWALDSPWWVYYEIAAGGRVIARYWLIETGHNSDVAPALGNAAGPPMVADEAVSVAASTGFPQTAAASEPWAGWWWPLADWKDPNLFDTTGSLRPMQIYDEYFKDAPGGSPQSQPWEAAHHQIFAPGEGSEWSGHCHAWAAAAILDSKANPLKNRAPFTKGDLEGLLTESYYGSAAAPFSYFLGGSAHDTAPMTPKDFWTALRDNIQSTKRPVIFDLYGGDQVWNYPVYSFKIALTKVLLREGNYVKGEFTATIKYERDDVMPGGAPEYRNGQAVYKFTACADQGSPVTCKPGDTTGTGIWLSSDYSGVFPDVAWYPLERRPGNPEVDYRLVAGAILIEPPAGLKGSSTTTAVNLQWSGKVSGAQRFEVERRSDTATPWQKIGEAATAKFIDSQPPTDLKLYYRVRISNPAIGYSLYSNVAEVVKKDFDANGVIGCAGRPAVLSFLMNIDIVGGTAKGAGSGNDYNGTPLFFKLSGKYTIKTNAMGVYVDIYTDASYRKHVRTDFCEGTWTQASFLDSACVLTKNTSAGCVPIWLKLDVAGKTAAGTPGEFIGSSNRGNGIDTLAR